MERNKKGMMILLPIFLLLGVLLGTSITSFILFLNKNDNLLAVISYLFLAVFTLLAIVTIFVINKYHILFNGKGKTNEEEK